MGKKKDKGIELSPEHGVNPSMELCFWCGKCKGVALLGRIHKKKGDKTDIEAPHEICLGLEPCDDCKKKFAQGVNIIEVDDDESRFNGNKAFAIKDSNGHVHWPTGRFAVVKPGAVADGKAGSSALCDHELMDRLLASSSK